MAVQNDNFAAHFDSLKKFNKIELSAGSDYWQNEEQGSEEITRMISSVEAAAKVFANDVVWINQFLEIGRQTASQRKPWIELIDFVDQCNDEFSDKEALVLSHGPSISTEQDLPSHLETCRAIIKHLEAGKHLKSFFRWTVSLGRGKARATIDGIQEREVHGLLAPVDLGIVGSNCCEGDEGEEKKELGGNQRFCASGFHQTL